MYQVVIVEDDPMVAAIDRRYVEMDSAFQVARLCKNGMEGLDYLSSHPADLVILDYYTPSMTGMEFLDRLHAMGKAPAVIMVTSASDSQIVQGMLSRGVLDYLVKPFQYARFQQALERFVQAQQLLEDGAPCLDQSSIDCLVRGRSDPPAAAAVPLAKGLNAGTLDKVRCFFADHPGCQFTSEQVAEHLGLSRITIRRYVNHMAEAGEIVSSIDYQTGGRPAIRYSLKSAAL
ncbi:response regulator [Pseudoflavonifractor phocaeensis]|uniref:response regulator n=1 Tax=Pseudoflavonifractor phocaeensis TaxID=1870988 RepID=UPI001F45602F|nr:response regulator [Pseudoflavonifractor phocaeensis]MCF2661275.1 response regulator [Pseudoflavonifractor phocaeensis]